MRTRLLNSLRKLTTLFFAYRREVPSDAAPAERIGLAEALVGLAGKWVAVDRTTNQPILVEDSPYALSARIRTEGRRNVAIVRAPDPAQPELVGLG